MITPKLHLVWLGNKPVPMISRFYMQTWIDINPDLEVILWTNDSIKNESFVNQELIETHPNVLIRSDVLRLELISKYGGIYADMDYQCLHPIQYLLKYEGFIASIQPDAIRPFTNSIFGFVQGHPTVGQMVEDVAGNIENCKHLPLYAQTGSAWFSRYMLPLKTIVRVHEPAFIKGAPGEIYNPDEYLDTFAVHHTR